MQCIAFFVLEKFTKLYEEEYDKEKKNKKGFTLAELLIVIGLIGILAALTVPMLYNHANNKHLVSQTIKMANALTNGFKEADVIDGLTKKSTTKEFRDAFEAHLKLLSSCDEGYVCLADGGRFQYQMLAGEALDVNSDNVVMPSFGPAPGSDGKAAALKQSLIRLLVVVNYLKIEK